RRDFHRCERCCCVGRKKRQSSHGPGGWRYRRMVLILSDSRDVERSLQKNVTLAKNAGAVLRNELVIKCADGTLSVEAPPECVGQVLIRLPWECQVPVELFELSV